MLVIGVAGCGGSREDSQGGDKSTIQAAGSDTMVNLAQMWSEAYETKGVSVEVSGGGSGVGVRDLIQGLIEIANCSREMKASSPPL